MKDICKDCPIILSCQHKYTKPTRCLHKPAQIGTNLSNVISNLGRRRIAMSTGGGCDTALNKIANDERKLRIGLCEGWE
jgi:hypothetical protein